MPTFLREAFEGGFGAEQPEPATQDDIGKAIKRSLGKIFDELAYMENGYHKMQIQDELRKIKKRVKQLAPGADS